MPTTAKEEHNRGLLRLGVRLPENPKLQLGGADLSVGLDAGVLECGRGLPGLAAELGGVLRAASPSLFASASGKRCIWPSRFCCLSAACACGDDASPAAKNNRHHARQRLKVRQTNGKSLSRGRGHAPAGTKPKTDVTNSCYLCLHCGFLLLIGGCFPDAAWSGGRFEMGLHFLIQPRSTRKASASARVLA